MNDVVGRFCDDVHGKLESLQGRLESLKLNIGATYHLLHQKVVEIRRAGEVRQLLTMEARASLEQWIEVTSAETNGRTEHENWIPDAEYLSERAKTAECCVEAALMLAAASIDDAEWMILEAIAARRESDAVTRD